MKKYTPTSKGLYDGTNIGNIHFNYAQRDE